MLDLYSILMALKRHLWYTDLVLATMERSSELIFVVVDRNSF